MALSSFIDSIIGPRFPGQQSPEDQRRDQQALWAALFAGAPQDQVNITPRVGAPDPSSQALMNPTAQQVPAQPLMPNMQPMGADNPQLAQRAAAGAYNGPAAPLMQGPQADQLKALLSQLSPETAMPFLSSLLQSKITPKAPIDVANDHNLVMPGADGKYTPVYTSPPKTPTYAEAPHTGINPATGKQDQFIIGSDGSQKWLSTSPGPNVEFINGQAVDKNAVTPGTVIPQQAPQPTAPLSKERFDQDAQLAGIRAKATADNRAPVAGELPPDTVKFYAEQALAGDKSVFAMVGRNQAARAQIAQAVQELGAQRGLSGQDMAALNAQFVGDTQAQRTIGQRTGAIAVSGEEAKGVATLVKDAYAKLPRGQFRPFNQLASIYANQTNSPEQGAAYTADFSLQTAYARALNPQGVPRETDIEKAAQLMNGADSIEKHNAVVDQMLKEIDVIQNSTGAARIAAINRIRESRGLPKASDAPPAASNANIDDILKKYPPKNK